MKAIEFPQQTMVLAKDQPEYNNLPVFISNDDQRQMISCYQLDDEELAIINKTKVIWQGQLTFGRSYSPSFVTVGDPFLNHEVVEGSKFISIVEVAKEYGRILKFQWTLDLNHGWNSGEGKVNARLLRDMEDGKIRNVKLI